MTDETRHRREPPLSIRLPKGGRAEIARRAEQAGLSVNAYAAKALLDLQPPRRTRRPPAEVRAVVRLLPELAAIRDRLDTLGGADTAVLEEVVALLTEIRNGIMAALGRRS